MSGGGRGAAGARVAALALAALLPACGGDGGTTPDTPTRTQIGSGTFTVVGTEEANQNGYNADVAAGPFVLANGGTVEILADWTSSANNIDIFLYLGSCSSEQARSAQCPVANRTTSTTNKPERLNVIGVPAGSYSLGFANFGPTAENGTFQVFLTR
jgi:hypothetical protein